MEDEDNYYFYEGEFPWVYFIVLCVDEVFVLLVLLVLIDGTEGGCNGGPVEGSGGGRFVDEAEWSSFLFYCFIEVFGNIFGGIGLI